MEAAVTETPEPSERGRYAVFEQPDGGLIIPRSAPLCDRCASCKCGEQQDPVKIPGTAMDFHCPECEKEISPFHLLPIIAGLVRGVQTGRIKPAQVMKMVMGR
jgi:hypothetical protein